MSMSRLKIAGIAILIITLSIGICYGEKGGNGDRGKDFGHEKQEQREQIREMRQEDRMERQQERMMERTLERRSETEENCVADKELREHGWFFNPKDDRGQGNMGRPDMLDPFGHDKDSNRKELYGNRGRVIKEVAPEPEPEPEPDPVIDPPAPEPDPEPEPEPPPEPPWF